MTDWTDEKIKIDLLKKHPKNPRRISKDAFARLCESIEKLGYYAPIIIDESNTILAGHQRFEALKKLGYKEITVRKPNPPLTDEQKLRLLATDNLSRGDWDIDILANEFNYEQLVDWGFDESILKDIVVEPIEGLTDENEVPEAPKKPVTVLGDIWLLGKHRLMCGDSTQIDAVEKLMDGKKADMVFTDPPYRMEAEGGIDQPVGRAAAKLGESIKHLCDFNPVAFLNMLPIAFAKNTMNSFIFCNKDLVPDYLNWAVGCGYSFNILFWKKPNAIPLGGQHRPDTEYLLYFRKNAIWNNALKDANYSKCLEFGRDKSTPHPTMKPVSLIENQIAISSNFDSTVFDPFGGSGSTLIACEKTQRYCRMMELDPIYCDVIVQRWQKFTGQQAVHAETGVLFDDMLKLKYA